jgi:hypothetical protein
MKQVQFDAITLLALSIGIRQYFRLNPPKQIGYILATGRLIEELAYQADIPNGGKEVFDALAHSVEHAQLNAETTLQSERRLDCAPALPKLLYALYAKSQKEANITKETCRSYLSFLAEQVPLIKRVKKDGARAWVEEFMEKHWRSKV